MFYINGRFLTQPITGVNRFALEICKSLKEKQVSFKIIVPNWLDYLNEYHFDIIQHGNLKSHFWEQYDLLRFLKIHGSPLLVNFSGLGPLLYQNQIMTIHDLSFYVNPKWFSFFYRKLYNYATPILAKKAKAIITVSFFSKAEIMKFLSIPEDKITVIYNAVSSFSSQPNRKKKLIIEDRPFVLAVSSLDPRKNHHKLIEAFDAEEFLNYDLLLVGKSANHFNLDLDQSSRQNIKFLGYVTDADLEKLYQSAKVFVYPSLYEGFGIPPLEAMSYSCPVVVSDIEVLREVCGDAAIYVDPYDAADIRQGILTVLNDQVLRENLIVGGKSREPNFSWKKSAQKVELLIDKISHESSSNY